MRRSKRSQQDKLSRVSGPAEPQSSEPSSHNETVNAAHIRWLSVLLVVCGCVVYANSLTNPFVFDDEVSIVGNQQIRNLQSLSSVLSPERELPTAGRPLANLSLAINYAADGLQPSGYHATNIALHIFCALLLFAIVRRTLEMMEITRVHTYLNLHGRETAVAFSVALIWMVHPLNSEVVDYLTERTESLMALFYLATLYANIRALTSGGRSGIWQGVAVAACVAGMLCKESMVTAPVAILLFDRVVAFDSFSAAFRQRWKFYGGLAASWLVLGALLSTGPRQQSAGFAAGVSPWLYLVNQGPLLIRYLRLMVWPDSLVANYGFPAAPATASAVASGIAIVLLGIATLVAWSRNRLSWAFLGAWFFLTLAPTSSIVPIATEVGAERRMYLPSIAVILLLVMATLTLWDRARTSLEQRGWRSGWLARVPVALLLLASATFALLTVERNAEYGSALGLAQVTLDRYPTPVAHHVLARELVRVGRQDEAIAHLHQATEGDPRAHYTLGEELYKTGRLDEAINEFQIFVRERPLLAQVIEAHGYLGKAFAKQERWPDAIAEFRQILAIDPRNAPAEHSLADVFFAANSYSEAADHYAKYLELQPGDVEALNQLAASLGRAGQIANALSVLQRAEALDPKNPTVERNLATAFWSEHDAPNAIAHARRSLALQPDDAELHELVGQMLAATGQVNEAADEFRQALAIAPQLGSARADLTRLEHLNQ